jgi:beta-xylosidase
MLADPRRPANILFEGEDVPNGFVLVDEGVWYLYASQGIIGKQNLPLRTSDDGGQTWRRPRDTMPLLAAWVEKGNTWAPDVRRIGDRYVMWYTARLAGQEKATQCIGVAVADSPEGPFAPEPDPRICQLERRGSIDPRTYQAPDGQLWIHWKSDDNADTEGNTKSSIYAQRLEADGITLIGEPTEMLTVTQKWEGRIVEAPQLVEGPGGRLWMFYSGNWFNQPDYGLGIAECTTPAGPCRKPYNGPWLPHNEQGMGPGEASFFTDEHGRTWMVYSPWEVRYRTPTPRPVALAGIGFDERGPYLADGRLAPKR